MFTQKLSPILAALALEACDTNYCEIKQSNETAEFFYEFEVEEFCQDTQKSVFCIMDEYQETPGNRDDIVIVPCASFQEEPNAQEAVRLFLAMGGTCFDESTVQYDCHNRYVDSAWVTRY